MELNPLIEAARKTGGQLSFTLTVPMGEQQQPKPCEQTTVEADPSACSHSHDFSCVNWNGTVYSFTPTQANIVAELWHAWQNRLPFCHQQGLLVSADSESASLLSVFKSHPAWGAMIVNGRRHGGATGTYCLFPFRPK